MRRKIAKRWRKKILKIATITAEYWDRDPTWKRKDCCYVVYGKCNGWKIAAPDYDELEAYKAFFYCCESCLEKPFDESEMDRNGKFEIGDSLT